MKKKLIGIFILLLLAATVAACKKIEFKVSFIVDDEVYATLNTSGDETIKMPDDPTKEAVLFDGWFWDKDT
jgi:hypothetical protein